MAVISDHTEIAGIRTPAIGDPLRTETKITRSGVVLVPAGRMPDDGKLRSVPPLVARPLLPVMISPAASRFLCLCGAGMCLAISGCGLMEPAVQNQRPAPQQLGYPPGASQGQQWRQPLPGQGQPQAQPGFGNGYGYGNPAPQTGPGYGPQAQGWHQQWQQGYPAPAGQGNYPQQGYPPPPGWNQSPPPSAQSGAYPPQPPQYARQQLPPQPARNIPGGPPQQARAPEPAPAATQKPVQGSAERGPTWWPGYYQHPLYE